MNNTRKMLLLSGGGAPPITWLFRDDFTVDAAPPIAGDNVANPGPGTLTIVDSANNYSRSGGKLIVAATGTVPTDIGYAKAIFAHQAGLAFMTKTRVTGTRLDVGWGPTSFGTTLGMGPGGSLTFVTQIPGGTALNIACPDFASEQQVAIIRTSGGHTIYAVGSRLIWYSPFVNATSYYARVQAAAAGHAGELDTMRVRLVGSPYSDDYGLASINVASPSSGSQYLAGSGELIIDMDLTAPGTLADSAGIKFRITDANNYWHAYFNSSGAFLLDQITAGTPTNRVNSAGAISAAQTSTIRVICYGTNIRCWTWVGTTVVYRGAATSSQGQSSDIIEPVLTGSWSIANLRAFPAELGVDFMTVPDG